MAKDQQDRELWEQQPGESGTLFAHFVFYRDMRYPKVTRQVKDEDGKIKKTTTETVMDGTVPYEKRSLRKTAEALGMNKRTIANQSAKWDWVRRCEAYDAHVDRMNREANEAAIRKMKQDHALLAQHMIRTATRRLLTMPDDEISAAELARIVDVGVKVERLSRGESTENQAVTHTGEVEVKRDAPLDLSGLSNEELDQFERLLEKISGASGG